MNKMIKYIWKTGLEVLYNFNLNLENQIYSLGELLVIIADLL